MREHRRTVWLLTITLILAGWAYAQNEEGDPPTEFDAYWMVFLERGDDPPQLEEEASAELQRQHLAHLGKVWNEGYALVAGPFDGGDELRGIVLYRGDLERDEVMELAGADPAVQAGSLKVRALKWYTPGGLLDFKRPPADEAKNSG